MSELVLNIVGIACVFIVALVFAYRLGPGLGDVMSAWAKKQQDLTVNRLAEEYVKGFQEGQELERQKREGVK